MEQQTSHKTHRWISWLLVLGVVCLIVIGSRIALKSDWLFDIVRDIAVEQANNQLSGTLSVQEIRGDLLYGFVISNIVLDDENGDRVIEADSIRLSYQLKDLIRSPFQLEDMNVHGVNAWMHQQQDSLWNVMTLIEAQETETDPTYWLINRINLKDVNVFVQSEFYLPDDSISVRQLNAELSAGMQESGFFGNLQSLNFYLEEQRLPDPVSFLMSGSGNEQLFTLETLVINSGRTLLDLSAEYDSDSENILAHVDLSPLSRSDLAAYLDYLPLQQDVNLDLGVQGTLSNLTVSLQATAPALENFNLRASANLSDDPVLTSLDINAENFNLLDLTGIKQTPGIQSFHFSGNGRVPFSNLETSDWSGSMELGGAYLDSYRLDRYLAEYSLLNGQVNLESQFVIDNQTIHWTASVLDIFEEIPQWDTHISSENLNLAEWLNNPSLESRLNIRANLQGRGIEPQNLTADASLQINESQFGNQPFTELSFTGSMNPNHMVGEFNGIIEESSLNLTIDVDSWMEVPEYEFAATILNLNLVELEGMEEFPTRINGTLSGTGTSFDPEAMQLQATAQFDSTMINNEQIDMLQTNFTVQHQYLTVDRAQLQSPIADADFTLRQHLFDFTNSENRLDFNLSMKDPMPLAVLFGLERLESQGSITGTISSNENGIPFFTGDLNLENIAVDSIFTSDNITGNVEALLTDEPEVDATVDIAKPIFNQQTVQDIHLNSKAQFRETETIGEIGFEVRDDENSLQHAGEFRLDSTTVNLHTTLLNFTTQLRTLELNRPFDLYVEDNNTIRIDTLSLQSENDQAYLRLWAPHIDSTRQEIGLDAKNLNLGALQSVIIDEPFFNGTLSGKADITNTVDSLWISVSGFMNSIRVENAEMDTLEFSMDVADEWLSGEIYARHSGKDLFKVDLRIPYLPGDPLTFDEEFFDRSVDGQIDLYNSDIKYWLSFVPEIDIEQTEGNISFYTVLSGVAGNPELDGSLKIGNGLFSGIPVDSIGMDLSYMHDEEQIEIEGGMISQRRQVFDFDARLPFAVDLKRAEILLPEDEDSVSANLKTNDFDLALFNNYVDRDMIRGLGGRLDGEVSLSGQLSNLQSRGRMDLIDGTMRIIPAGITINNMGSRVLFERDRIELQQFSMQSGPGQIRATGQVNLDNLSPSQIQLDIRGRQFRAANTTEYNAIIDLNASLTGALDQPNINGSLSFLNGFVNLQNFGERSVEDVRLEDEEEPETFAFYDSLAIEMDVNFNRQFYLRNRQYLDMEIELDGQVDLLKDRNSDLQMFGSVEGAEGYARPLGKNFELDQAVVTFYGPVEDPELNIRTRFEPPQAKDVRIFYIIEGTAQEPDFRFESEPEMELQDIFSYTLFGKPFYELEGWEQAVAGSGEGPSATDLAIDVLLDRVEMLASQRLGIDVVQIDNSGSGSTSTTSIETGWYLNRRTFFAILNEISSTRPKTLFILEYMLMDNLELIITQGDDSREGVDLRWHFDY